MLNPMLNSLTNRFGSHFKMKIIINGLPYYLVTEKNEEDNKILLVWCSSMLDEEFHNMELILDDDQNKIVRFNPINKSYRNYKIYNLRNFVIDAHQTYDNTQFMRFFYQTSGDKVILQSFVDFYTFKNYNLIWDDQKVYLQTNETTVLKECSHEVFLKEKYDIVKKLNEKLLVFT